MLTRFDGNLREHRRFRAVPLAVLASRTTEVLRGKGGVAVALDPLHHFAKAVEGRRTVGIGHRQRTALHLLETQRQHDVGCAVFDGLAGQEQR